MINYMTNIKTRRSNKLLLILFLIPIVLLVLTILVTAFWIKTESLKIVQEENIRVSQLSNDEKAKELGLVLMTQAQANTFSNKAFSRLNSYRLSKGLKPYAKDGKICQALKETLGHVKVWGDVEELGQASTRSNLKQSLNPLYNSTFLFSSAGISTASSASEQVDDWLNLKNASELKLKLLSTNLGTHACIEASPNAVLMLVAGNSK